MERFKGTYAGLAPTGSEGPGMGEFEVVIGARLIKTRMATGRGIQKESLFVAGFRQMTDEELRLALGSVDTAGSEHFVGFRHSTGFPAFFFHTDPEGGCVSLLLHVGREAQDEGPTVLVDEASVARGVLQEMLSILEGTHSKGMIPRLANHGRPGNVTPPD